MRSLVILIALVITVLFTGIPAIAEPNENASERAFLAQDIISCRNHMKDMVAAGQITRDQLNQCIQDMKAGACMQSTDSCACM